MVLNRGNWVVPNRGNPAAFHAERRGRRVLIASDGLWKYATMTRIRTLTLREPLAEAADALTACVRLPSGSLQDDVAVVLVSD